jgi:hypothetical protein
MVMDLRSLRGVVLGVLAAVAGEFLVVPSALSEVPPTPTSVPSASAPVQAISPRALLDRLVKAERAFDVGEFLTAESAARSCVEQRESFVPVDRDRLYLLQARLAFAFKRPEDVERWLRDLYRNNSKAELSALVDPPQMFAVWKKIGDEEQAKLAASSASQSAPQASTTQSGGASAPVASTSAARTAPSPGQSGTEGKEGADQPKPNVWNRAVDSYVKAEPQMKQGVRPVIALLPFGVGHFTYGKVWQGATFMVGETAFVLLVSGLADATNDRRDFTDSVSFASGRNESYQSGNDYEDTSRYSDQASAYTLFGLTGFAALWGVEIYNLLPEIAKDSPSTAKWSRFGLSFVPFGLAQLKNGEPVKAIGLAGSQALFLLLAGALPHENQRSLAQVMFLGSVVFGMVDGWLNHDWNVPVADPMKWSFAVAPLLQERGRPLGLQVGVSRSFN